MIFLVCSEMVAKPQPKRIFGMMSFLSYQRRRTLDKVECLAEIVKTIAPLDPLSVVEPMPIRALGREAPRPPRRLAAECRPARCAVLFGGCSGNHASSLNSG